MHCITIAINYRRAPSPAGSLSPPGSSFKLTISKYCDIANVRSCFMDSFSKAAADAGCCMEEKPRDLFLFAGARRVTLDTVLNGAIEYARCPSQPEADMEAKCLQNVFPGSWSVHADSPMLTFDCELPAAATAVSRGARNRKSGSHSSAGTLLTRGDAGSTDGSAAGLPESSVTKGQRNRGTAEPWKVEAILLTDKFWPRKPEGLFWQAGLLQKSGVGATGILGEIKNLIIEVVSKGDKGVASSVASWIGDHVSNTNTCYTNSCNWEARDQYVTALEEHNAAAGGEAGLVDGADVPGANGGQAVPYQPVPTRARHAPIKL